MKRYCLTLDLKDNSQLIAEYEEWHRKVSPAIIESIRSAGIEEMQLFRYDNRLMMIMDLANEDVQIWEKMLWKYQQPLPGTKPGEKWMLMKNIFNLSDNN
jgi:L-rhamnose mutarotase